VSAESADGSPAVEPADVPGAWVVRRDGMDQSCVDLDDPTALHFDYVRRIGSLLDAAAPAGEALRVLHVGGAGLTLPRYVAATRPGSRQVVLEPDEELTALVRERLPLPRRSGISVRPVDGRTGLAEVRDDWAQAVVVDAFDGAEVPGDLVDLGAWQEYARVLAPGGLLAVNLRDRAPFPRVRSAVAGAQAAWGDAERLAAGLETATRRGRREGNVLLVAGVRPGAAGEAGYSWWRGQQVLSVFGGG